MDREPDGGRYVALLRGVNVGGHNAVRMAELRALMESIGHTRVATYINSGNVVFTNGSPDLDRAELERGIEQAIAERLGLDLAVLVRSRDEVAAALAANPFPNAEPRRLLLWFLRAEPDPEVLARAGKVESGADEFRVLGSTVYLHCPDGMGRSKLAAELGKRLDVGTSRNLATMRKLLVMTEAGESSKGS